MESKIVYRQDSGVRRTSIVDTDNPFQLKVYTEVEMDEVLEGIKRARDNQNPHGVNKLVARVPMTVYEQSLLEQWDEADWKKWLNDPDNSAFRIWQGQV